MGSFTSVAFKDFHCVETLPYTQVSKVRFIIYPVSLIQGKVFPKLKKD